MIPGTPVRHNNQPIPSTSFTVMSAESQGTTRFPARRLAPLTGLIASAGLATGVLAGPPIVSQGTLIANDDWAALPTPFGYMDLALDQRPGFDGREYLSGEWAAAISFNGGPPMWLTPQMVFPDWPTGSTFVQLVAVEIMNPKDPFNKDGFPVFHSVIGNDHLRIENVFQMRDTETGILMGGAPTSQGGEGGYLVGNRYFFKHSYRITNISDEPMKSLHLHQMLHGLQSNAVWHDDRDYGGPWPSYRYDLTLRGMSYGFHRESGAIYEFTDYLTLHSKIAPEGIEAGYYGVKGEDSHSVGKPPVGVHLSIEAGSLGGGDSFEPEEGGFVAGATAYNLGSLGPGEMTELRLLFSVRTEEVLRYQALDFEVPPPRVEGDEMIIEVFEPMNLRDQIGLGFQLLTSPVLEKYSADSPNNWVPAAVPYFYNPKTPEKIWWRIPIDREAAAQFYLVDPVLGSVF